MVELSYQQIFLLVGITVFAMYWLCRCDTKHWIRFTIYHWWNRDLVRWLDHTETRLDNWNKKMTKPKWIVFTSLLISMVFVPIIVWSEFIYDGEKGFFGNYGIIIYLVEYFGLIGWTIFVIYKKKPQKLQNNTMMREN